LRFDFTNYSKTKRLAARVLALLGNTSWQFSFLAHEWLCVIDKDFPLLRYD